MFPKLATKTSLDEVIIFCDVPDSQFKRKGIEISEVLDALKALPWAVDVEWFTERDAPLRNWEVLGAVKLLKRTEDPIPVVGLDIGA